MGLIKRAADLTFTFRFIRMLVMDWKNWDAYKLGIIDDEGKRNRKVALDNDEKKSAYTAFIRLAANVKRLVSKIPGGGSKLGSFASALYLIKEKHGLDDTKLLKITEKLGYEPFDFLVEANMWFVLEDKRLSPGMYRVNDYKMLNCSFDEIVNPKDRVRVSETCYPVGDVFGIDVYEVTHINTNKNIYIVVSELNK